MNILQVCAYAGPAGGNFVASLSALEESMKEKGYNTIYALCETIRETAWARNLESRAKVYYLPVRHARINLKTYSILKHIFLVHDISIVHSHFELYDIPGWDALLIFTLHRNRRSNMNICFLEGDMSRRGGTERMTAVLANALCQRHSVWILSLHLTGVQPFFPLDAGVRHQVIPDGSGKRGMLRQIQKIRTFLRQESIDCVINVDTGMGIYGILGTVGTQARVITWEHSNFYNNWNSRAFPRLRRFAAKYSDALVVLTERDRENYRTNIPSKTPVYVIHNPAVRHEFQYDAESKIILSAGLLLPIKGYDKAVAAAAKVLPQRPDWKWIICGEGLEREHLEQLIAAAGLKEQMLLPGSVSNMDEQYQKAAIYVMTSQMEGLPMVLLEAKSWGLPIVSFDIMTGPGEIVRDGVNGYLVGSDNVDAMTKRLTELMDSPVLREEFSARSQLDMEQFDIAHIVEQWESVLGYEKEDPISSGGV